MYEKKVSIVIPTYKHLNDAMKPCLEAIIKYTDLSDKEVIVVCNGCGDDGTREYLEDLKNTQPSIRYLWYDEGLGYTKATNRGIEAAKGEYVILLNNDAFLLSQPVGLWVNQLIEPFERNPRTGVTGPMVGYSHPGECNFVIFFCACIKATVFQEVGLLKEVFGIGGGEDTTFCYNCGQAGYEIVQVPSQDPLQYDHTRGMGSGNFGIYHQGEMTMHDEEHKEAWPGIFEGNSKVVHDLCASGMDKGVLHNGFERAVYGATDVPDKREYNRYAWAAAHATGRTVLDIGCSSGYGYKFLKWKCPDYTGIDYDEQILKYAAHNFPNAEFKHFNLEAQKLEGHWDTIVAFEVLEHLTNGKTLAQELKKHCDTLLLTVPYREPKGLWGKWHVNHGLRELDFPGFTYSYMNEQGNISYNPFPEIINLMLMKWSKF